MSCRDGEECLESKKRMRALIILGLMLVIFIVLSAFSFLGSRDRVTPEKFRVGAASADDGKRAFQAYNCMGCHTIVGNGAYFAPDLTFAYREAGPAWLAAFVPSANTWPTEAAVKVQLRNPDIQAAAGVSDIEAYYKKFPGAKERVERRKGKTMMPNLTFREGEVQGLIAFFQYTSALNTQGWPPKVLIEPSDLSHRVSLAHGGRQAALPAGAGVGSVLAAPSAETPAAAADPAARGKELVQEFACSACHALDNTRLVGPGWGGIYGRTVKLEGGGEVTADDEYLRRAILEPNAQVVAGFAAGLMPSYTDDLGEDDVSAIIAYLRTLE